MRNQIDRVKAEFPTLDLDIIERIYKQLVVALLRQPTEDELRARIVELTTSMDGPTLRRFLGLRPKRRVGAGVGSQQTAVPASEDGRRRGPGRPGWTAELFWARYREACERADPPHTYTTIAGQFVTLDGMTGTSPEYLRRLVGRFGLPPG
jgi:hypothetical protein